MTSLEKLQLFNEKAETLRQYKRFMESIKFMVIKFMREIQIYRLLVMLRLH